MINKNLIFSLGLLLLLFAFGCSNDEDDIMVIPETEEEMTEEMEEETEEERPRTRTIISTLNVPWEMLWGPDDFLWVTERNGRISRINPENGVQLIIANLSTQIEQDRESGLLGMALHPDFTNSPYVYLVYTYRTGGNFFERLVRRTYANETLSDEIILLDGIPANNVHNGSRIIITPDNRILMTTGDAAVPARSQDINSLAGKLLRINLDGSIPSDNPDPSSYVYTLGHRNAQGLMIHSNGIIYSSEHGPNSDDEINIIEEGGNYGWPSVLGVINTPNEQAFTQNTAVVESIADWTPTIAPSDLIEYTSNTIPEFSNRLLLATLREQAIIALTLSEDCRAVIERQTYFEQEFGRIRDLVMAPDGRLFIATNGTSYLDNSNTHSIIEINRLSD